MKTTVAHSGSTLNPFAAAQLRCLHQTRLSFQPKQSGALNARCADSSNEKVNGAKPLLNGNDSFSLEDPSSTNVANSETLRTRACEDGSLTECECIEK